MGISRVKGIHLAIIAFLLLALLIIFIVPKQVLIVDEFWQYWQSRNLISGSNYHLDVSPSPLHNLLFAVFPSNVLLLRLINALLMSLAVYIFYKMIEMILGHGAAIISTAVFIIHEETLILGSLFYTEALFMIFYFLTFFYFFKLLKEDKLKNYLLFGLCSGLMIQSRLIGLLIYGFLLIYLLIKQRPQLFSKKLLWSFLITLVINLPYIVVSRLSFILKRPVSDLGLIEKIDSGQWINLLLLVIIIIFFLYRRTKKKTELELLIYFSFFYYFILNLFVSDVFPRHFYILVPFLIVVLIGSMTVLNKNKLVLAGTIISFLFINYLYFKPVESYINGNYFLLNNDNCFFVDKMDYQCPNLVIPERINLPFYQQPVNSDCSFAASFKTNQLYGYLFLSYLDDYGPFKFDQNSLYAPHPLKVNKTRLDIPAGEHQIELSVHNTVGPGGIGQIALCKNDPINI